MTVAALRNPSQLAFHPVTARLFFTDRGNNALRFFGAGALATLAGRAAAGFVDGAGSAAAFNSPAGLAVNASGWAFVADTSNSRLRIVSPLGEVRTLAGSAASGSANGVGTNARFDSPASVAAPDDLGLAFVADWNSNLIRVVTLGSGSVATLAGNGSYAFADGPGPLAAFRHPHAVTANASGWVWVSDTENFKIRLVSPAGAVRTLAGSFQGFADGVGTAAAFVNPMYSALAPGGTLLLVADSSAKRIRAVALDGTVTTIAGTGAAAYTDGFGTATAAFFSPTGLAFGPAGSGIIYVGDGARLRQLRCPFAPYFSASASRTPSGSPSPSPSPTPSGSP